MPNAFPSACTKVVLPAPSSPDRSDLVAVFFTGSFANTSLVSCDKPESNTLCIAYNIAYMVVFADDEQQKRLDFLRKREEEELAQVLSGKYGVQYVDLSLVAVNVDALRVITEAEAKDAEAAAFGRVGKKLSVAVRAPENPKVKILAAKLHDMGYDVTLYMCSKASLERAYQRYADLSYATETKAGVFELSNEELEQLNQSHQPAGHRQTYPRGGGAQTRLPHHAHIGSHFGRRARDRSLRHPLRGGGSVGAPALPAPRHVRWGERRVGKRG